VLSPDAMTTLSPAFSMAVAPGHKPTADAKVSPVMAGADARTLVAAAAGARALVAAAAGVVVEAAAAAAAGVKGGDHE